MADEPPPPYVYQETEPEKTLLAGGGGLPSAPTPDLEGVLPAAYPPQLPASSPYPPSSYAEGQPPQPTPLPYPTQPYPPAQQVPPGGYPVSVPPPPVSTVSVPPPPVSTRPAVVTPTFGAHPLANFQCPYCGNVVTTRTRKKRSQLTYIIMLIACIFIGCFALIFLCIPIFDDVEHVCPVDGKVVGVHKSVSIS